MTGTAGTFWNIGTPEVAEGDIYRAYLPVRLQGAAPDGSQDTFAQMQAPSALDVTGPAVVAGLGFTPVQQGTGPQQLANDLAFGWNGDGGLLFSVDENPSVFIPYYDTVDYPTQPIFNIGPYQDNAVVMQTAGQHNTPGAFGYSGEGVPMGQGPIYVARHHLAYVSTNVLSDGYVAAGGGSWALDGMTIHVGGADHNTVVEGRSDLVVYDNASPSCTNSNTVANQARAFITVDGTTAESNMCMFGFAAFVAGGPEANNFNLCGAEFDIGTTNNGATFTRSGLNVNSIGSAKGGAHDHAQPWYDAGLLFTSGPQFGSVQQANKAGFLCGVAFSSHYGDETPGICEPISSDGFMIGAFGAWACKSVLYASEITTSGPAIDLPVSTNGTGGIRFGNDASIYRDQAAGLRLPAMIGFGKASVGPSAVHSPGSGADAISIAINDLRNCLINNGLAVPA